VDVRLELADVADRELLPVADITCILQEAAASAARWLADFHGFYEYSTYDRFQGTSLVLTLGKKF
jgi:hypothetical protein